MILIAHWTWWSCKTTCNNMLTWFMTYERRRIIAQLEQNPSLSITQRSYSKTCVKRQLSKGPKIGFQDQLSLNAGQKYCRMLQGEGEWSILQYFRHSLSYHLSLLRSLFCLFSGRFTNILQRFYCIFDLISVLRAFLIGLNLNLIESQTQNTDFRLSEIKFIWIWI